MRNSFPVSASDSHCSTLWKKLLMVVMLSEVWLMISKNSGVNGEFATDNIPLPATCSFGIHYDILGYNQQHQLVRCYRDATATFTAMGQRGYYILDFNKLQLLQPSLLSGRNLPSPPSSSSSSWMAADGFTDPADLVVWLPHLVFQGGGDVAVTMLKAGAQLLLNGTDFPSILAMEKKTTSSSASSSIRFPHRLTRMFLLNTGYDGAGNAPMVCDDPSIAQAVWQSWMPFYFNNTQMTQSSSSPSTSGSSSNFTRFPSLSYIERALLCPDVIMLGTAQPADRAARNNILPMTSFLEAWQTWKGTTIQDDFLRFYFYDVFLNNVWYGIPLSVDTRYLFYNKTTFNRLGLRPPPPLSITDPASLSSGKFQEWPLPTATSWTWELLADYAKILDDDAAKYLALSPRDPSTFRSGAGFQMFGCGAEEIRMFATFARNYRAELLVSRTVRQNISAMISSSSSSSVLNSLSAFAGLGSSSSSSSGSSQAYVDRTFVQCGLRNNDNIAAAVDRVFRRMYLEDQSASLSYAVVNTSDPSFQAWLQTPVNSTSLPSLHNTVIPTLGGPSKTLQICPASFTDPSNTQPLWGMGIVFASSFDDSAIKKFNLGIGLVPGSGTWLGGALICLAQTIPSHPKIDLASSLIALLVDTSQPYIHSIAVTYHVLPPFESAWSMPQWSSPAYDIIKLQLKSAKTTEYPIPVLPASAQLEDDWVFRKGFVEFLYKRVSTRTFIDRVCDNIDYLVQPICTIQDYSLMQDPSVCGGVKYVWNSPKICRDGVALPPVPTNCALSTPSIIQYSLVSSSVISIQVISGIAFFFIFLLAVFIFLHQGSRVVYQASLLVLITTLCCSSLTLIYIFLRLVSPLSSSVCTLLPYLISLACTIFLSVIIVHLWLLDQIFSNFQLRVAVPSTFVRYLRMACLCGPTLITLFVWSALNYGKNMESADAYDGQMWQADAVCRSSYLTQFWSTLFAIHVVLVLIVIRFLARLRSFDASITRFPYLTALLVHHVIVAAIIHVVYIATPDIAPRAWILLVTVALLESVIFTLAVIFGKPIMDVVTHRRMFVSSQLMMSVKSGGFSNLSVNDPQQAGVNKTTKNDRACCSCLSWISSQGLGDQHIRKHHDDFNMKQVTSGNYGGGAAHHLGEFIREKQKQYGRYQSSLHSDKGGKHEVVLSGGHRSSISGPADEPVRRRHVSTQQLLPQQQQPKQEFASPPSPSSGGQVIASAIASSTAITAGTLPCRSSVTFSVNTDLSASPPASSRVTLSPPRASNAPITMVAHLSSRRAGLLEKQMENLNLLNKQYMALTHSLKKFAQQESQIQQLNHEISYRVASNDQSAAPPSHVVIASGDSNDRSVPVAAAAAAAAVTPTVGSTTIATAPTVAIATKTNLITSSPSCHTLERTRGLSQETIEKETEGDEMGRRSSYDRGSTATRRLSVSASVFPSVPADSASPQALPSSSSMPPSSLAIDPIINNNSTVNDHAGTNNNNSSNDNNLASATQLPCQPVATASSSSSSSSSSSTKDEVMVQSQASPKRRVKLHPSPSKS